MFKKIYYWLRNKLSAHEEKGEASAGIWHRKIRETALERCLGIPGNILEIGCGEGLFLKELLSANRDVKATGIDLSQDQLDRAQIRLSCFGDRVQLLNTDAGMLPFAENIFDAVICVNVFINIPDMEKLQLIFNQLARVCKKGGVIIFDIRNKKNAFVRLKYALVKYYDGTIRKEQLNTYTVRQLEDIVCLNNCRVIKKIPVGFPGSKSSPVIIFEAQKC